jgi:membrane protein DedA with SNARE-associated domain
MINKLLLYLAVFSGCFFEGETSLVTSSFAAHRGYLEIFIVIIIAFVATQSWDWIWFLVGRKRGKAFIAKKPKLEKKAARIDALLMKNQTLVLLGYRFLYGFRTAVPLTIGISSIPTRKFFIFSFINTLVWDCLFSSLGYYFGAFMKANWKRIEQDEFKIMGAILLIGILTGLFLRYRSMKKVTVEAVHSSGNNAY